VVSLVVAALLAHTIAPPRWTLAHARAVLASRSFAVTDTSQRDRPRYQLTFSSDDVRRLRVSRGNVFVYSGPAHDLQTDTSFPVRFTFTTLGRLTRFRGPPANLTQPRFPIHAAFFYGWYPEAWRTGAKYPYTRYHPLPNYYSADQPDVVHRQVQSLLYGHLDAGIYSWWGRGTRTDGRFARYLAAARRTPLRWAAYYEQEGQRDPSVTQIRSDLKYLRNRYSHRPAYLKVRRRFVVFVYGDQSDGCGTAARWHAANAGINAYVVLKVFPGYQKCADQPDAWHQYAGAKDEDAVESSYTIAPGFNEIGEPSARLPRDLARFQRNIADMVASKLPWQLVISFNEWIEGTAVEDAAEWQTPSGYGAYLDALHAGLP
jgi:hypothetical protein